MFIINDNEISLTRGDYACFDIDIYDYDNNPYTPLEGEVVTFTLKKSPNTRDHIVQKTGTTVVINGEDTENLPYGTYSYDVQLTHADGRRDTFIPPTPFHITPEVTW